VSLAIGDDHEFLAAAVTGFASRRCGPEVARAAADSPDGALPPFWAELDELGWLTLDRDGGLGFSELVVVLEGLGRAVAPGPILATAWARAVAAAADGDAISAYLDGPSAVLTGDGPVLGGAAAGVIVASGANDAWAVLGPEGFRAAPQQALDSTAGLAAVELLTDPSSGVALPGLTHGQVESVGIVLAAAEAVGGAAWCVDNASSAGPSASSRASSTAAPTCWRASRRPAPPCGTRRQPSTATTRGARRRRWRWPPPVRSRSTPSSTMPRT
jgi:hypothetical protein